MVLFAFVAILADTLVLKDGRVLQGTFKGGTDNTVIFEVDGTVQQIAVGDITSLTFSPRTAQTATEPPTTLPPAEAGVTAAAETQSEGEVTIPAGTKIMLKTREPFATSTHQAGSKFTAELETDLVVNGVVAAPKGTTVYGKVLESIGGRRIGCSALW